MMRMTLGSLNFALLLSIYLLSPAVAWVAVGVLIVFAVAAKRRHPPEASHLVH